MDDAQQSKVQNHIRMTTQVNLDSTKRDREARKQRIQDHIKRTQS